MRSLFIGFFISLLFVSVVHATPSHPWINTAYYDLSRSSGGYSANEVNFIADNYDIVIATMEDWNGVMKDRNPGQILLRFNYLATLGTSSQNRLLQYYTIHPEYNIYPLNETIYLHYACDTYVQGVLFRGCNLQDPNEEECTGIANEGCQASTATNIRQSRVPDPLTASSSNKGYIVNYTSDLYRSYGIWLSELFLAMYESDGNPTHYADGMWWDNVLYLPGYVTAIKNTTEYFGESDPVLGSPGGHRYNQDYNAYFSSVTEQVNLDKGRELIWLGNVNAMFWIQSLPTESSYISWVLDTLDYFSPESWVSPLEYGEENMPTWLGDCKDLQEAWMYSHENGKKMLMFTYNRPGGGAYPNPDQRTKTFSIAKYYLTKNANLYYGYSQDDTPSDANQSMWNHMADVDIGLPRTNPAGVKDFQGNGLTDIFFDWNNPASGISCDYYDWTNTVMARHFDNGLVIARWKGNRCVGPGPDCNSYIDPRTYNIANPYGTEYYLIQPNGTLESDPVSAVTLGTNEAAVLLKKCAEGTADSPCGCKGNIIHEGDTCVESCPLQTYDPECDNIILSQSVIAALNDWLSGTISMETLINVIDVWKHS
jgi:hypothetical protein